MEDLSALVRERRSVRRYLPREVPREVIQEIIDDARWAPSWGNTQSPTVYVFSGDALDRVKAMLLERALGDAPGAPDIEMPAPPSWPEPYRSRSAALMKVRFDFVATEEKRLGIAPPDPPVPPPVAGAGLFGAPHLLLVATAAELSLPYTCFDSGLLAQTIALAATSRGLGTCIMAGVIRHPDIFRALIPDSDDLVFVVGITLGYADLEAPVNRFPRERAPLDERLFFVDG